MNPPPTAPQLSQTPTFTSGYDHGCDDAKISDVGDRYINQPEKGPSYHTEEFMQGYDDGYNECSNDGSSTENPFKSKFTRGIK